MSSSESEPESESEFETGSEREKARRGGVGGRKPLRAGLRDMFRCIRSRASRFRWISFKDGVLALALPLSLPLGFSLIFDPKLALDMALADVEMGRVCTGDGIGREGGRGFDRLHHVSNNQLRVTRQTSSGLVHTAMTTAMQLVQGDDELADEMVAQRESFRCSLFVSWNFSHRYIRNNGTWLTTYRAVCNACRVEGTCQKLRRK